MQPFLAMIMPIGQSGEVPGVPGVPTHPIYNPAYPDNSLPQPQPPGGGGVPTHPIARPPGVPTHPIYNPAYPDNSLPRPPGVPTHPIYIPPEGTEPPLGIWGPPQMPPGYWGGGMGPGVKPQPHPEHPIVLPPDLPPETGDGAKIEWKTAWTEQTGWIVVGIPSEGTLVPTPSKA